MIIDNYTTFKHETSFTKLYIHGFLPAKIYMVYNAMDFSSGKKKYFFKFHIITQNELNNFFKEEEKDFFFS